MQRRWRRRAGTAQAAAATNVAASTRAVAIAIAVRQSMVAAAHAGRTHCIAVQLVVAVRAAHHIDLYAIVLQIGIGERAVRLVL